MNPPVKNPKKKEETQGIPSGSMVSHGPLDLPCAICRMRRMVAVPGHPAFCSQSHNAASTSLRDVSRSEIQYCPPRRSSLALNASQTA